MSDKNSEFAEEAEQERFENKREGKGEKTWLIVLENNNVNIDVVFFWLQKYKKRVKNSEWCTTAVLDASMNRSHLQQNYRQQKSYSAGD